MTQHKQSMTSTSSDMTWNDMTCHIAANHSSSPHVTSQPSTLLHLTPQAISWHQNRSHQHHGTAEGSFTAKKWFGHRAGRSPCAHSIGKFFLWLISFFLLKLVPPACPGTTGMFVWIVLACTELHLPTCVCIHLCVCACVFTLLFVPTNIHVGFWIPHLQIHFIYTHQTIWMSHKITIIFGLLSLTTNRRLGTKMAPHVCIQLANTVTDLNSEGFGQGGKFCHATVMFNSSASCFLCFFGTMFWQCWLNLSHPAFRICYHSKEKNVGSWKLDSLWLFLEGINLALPRKTRFHLGDVFTVHFIVKFRTCPFAPRLAKNHCSHWQTASLGKQLCNLLCWQYLSEHLLQVCMSFWDENQ